MDKPKEPSQRDKAVSGDRGSTIPARAQRAPQQGKMAELPGALTLEGQPIFPLQKH